MRVGALLACGLTFAALACGNSTNSVDGGWDGADAVVFDPIDWDASLGCVETTCEAGELCIRTQGPSDGPPTTSACYRVPDGCVAYPTCDCITAVAPACSSKCRTQGQRRFTCGEGI